MQKPESKGGGSTATTLLQALFRSFKQRNIQGQSSLAHPHDALHLALVARAEKQT